MSVSSNCSKIDIIKEAIDSLIFSFESICAEVIDVEQLDFHQVHTHFEKLEEILKRKTLIDAAFAFIAERDHAGRLVGSARSSDYLTKTLGLTRAEAAQRLAIGQSLYEQLNAEPQPQDEPTEPIEPEDIPEPDPTLSEEEQERQRREAEEEARRKKEEAEAEARRKQQAAQEEAERRAERERKAQEERRRQMAEEAASAEIAKIIEQELRNLNKYAQPGPQELRTMAMAESKNRSPEDLRKWLRKQVKNANIKGTMPNGSKDPFAATRKRYFWMSEPDADGTVHIKMSTDAVGAALLSKVLAPAQRPGGPNLPPEEDNRSFPQRRHDQLMEVCSQYIEGKDPKSGLGSIVLSAALDELENLTPDAEFKTDTGHTLNLMDLVRLGEGASDYLAILDPESFQPLALGRSKRTASFAQKLALFAAELCCTGPGCNTPMSETDVHHLVAWQHGGATDIANLTLLCRRHHMDNNDNHDFHNGMGHSERDPESGRVGKRMPGEDGLIFNESTTAEESAAAHYRRRAQEKSARGPDDDAGPPPRNMAGPPDNVHDSGALFDIGAEMRDSRKAS
ncbi:DUF222 domain-containing protein [Corynebacterium sp. L4756]|uniref:HNH endonuclease signature motif containing protein n=1 Tax=unclassified Corynebacterium TaxID=2624378 RepID=UPI00374D8A7D